MPELTHDKQLEILLTEELQALARHLSDELPQAWGFGLIVFPFNAEAGTSVLWVSSALRADMVVAVEGLAESWRRELGLGKGTPQVATLARCAQAVLAGSREVRVDGVRAGGLQTVKTEDLQALRMALADCAEVSGG